MEEIVRLKKITPELFDQRGLVGSLKPLFRLTRCGSSRRIPLAFGLRLSLLRQARAYLILLGLRQPICFNRSRISHSTCESVMLSQSTTNAASQPCKFGIPTTRTTTSPMFVPANGADRHMPVGHVVKARIVQLIYKLTQQTRTQKQPRSSERGFLVLVGSAELFRGL